MPPLDRATDARPDSGAVEDGPYRYLLWRTLAPLTGKGTLLVCMLNPSSAGAVKNDPTMVRVIGFAAALGYRLLEVVNLYAWRSTDPRGLLQASDPVGPENDQHIAAAAARADRIIVAWGAGASHYKNRVSDVLCILGSGTRCLGTTHSGHPRHPLRVAKNAAIVPYLPE